MNSTLANRRFAHRSMTKISAWKLGAIAALTLVTGSALPAQAAVSSQRVALVTPAQAQLRAQIGTYESLIEQAQQQLDMLNYDNALATFQTAIDSAPEQPRAWVGKGEALYGLGQFSEAVTAFAEATKLAPDYQYAWIWLGNAYDDNGQLEASLAAYAQAIALDGTNPLPYYHRGIALWYDGQGAAATADFQRVSESVPDFPKGWMWLGRSLAQVEDYEGAIAAFDQALALDANERDALFGKGLSLIDLERYDEAVSVFDEFVALVPDAASGWFYQGYSLFGLERYDEALEAYARSLEIDNMRADTWYNQGLTLIELERYEDAKTSFEQVLAIDPENSNARRQLEDLP
ncbi:MAG: tetratricopeptide repeat protein [Phormidesmis sp.]